MRTNIWALVTLSIGLVTALPLRAGEPPAVPSAATAVARACDAAGGLDAFRSLGIVEVSVTSDEVTQDGSTSSKSKNLFFAAPGPIPGRLEVPSEGVIAGDDGSGGWAFVSRRPDARPSTSYMVKRSMATYLFPILLPFSLNWEGVTVSQVTPAAIGDLKVWRLHVVLPRSFFDTPQIATEWTVDLNQANFALVRAESTATDLGQGLTADGMHFGWTGAVKLSAVRLPSEQRVIGLDALGNEKTHSRIDHLKYSVIPSSEATRVFANPIPPDQRPKLPAAGTIALPPTKS